MGSSMTIGRRFIITSGVLILLSTLMAIVAIVGFNGVETNMRMLATDSIPGITYIEAIRGDIFELRGDYLKHIGCTDATAMAALDASIADDQAELDKDMKTYENSIFNDADRQNFNQVKDQIATFQQVWSRVRPLSEALQSVQAYDQYISQAPQIIASLGSQIKTMVEWNQQNNARSLANTASTLETSRSLSIGAGVLSLLLGIGLSWFMITALNRELTQTIQELAQGSAQIASAATQVATSSQALAQGASEQAATIEETSSASTEVNSMAQRNTENSQTAAATVVRAGEGFAIANQSLDEMVSAMDGINTSSNKISKIIKVIDEIAFQTNILALNAAVEAARAGEAGMGFAVVADEVRNLAQRCAKAAKDTADLIEESIERSESGKTKVDHVAAAIRTLTGDSSQLKTLVEEINLGSIEQSRGIDQISKAISQMEQVTQSSAANSEQGAAAAEQLNAQADSLKEVVRHLTRMVNRNGSEGATTRARADMSDAWKMTEA